MRYISDYIGAGRLILGGILAFLGLRFLLMGIFLSAGLMQLILYFAVGGLLSSIGLRIIFRCGTIKWAKRKKHGNKEQPDRNQPLRPQGSEKEQLEQLDVLYRAGMYTKEEYLAEKNKILSQK